MKARRIGGLILVILAYVEGINVSFYAGILPAIGGVWSWNEYGMILVVGVVISMVLYVVGNLLRHGRNIGRV